MISVADGVYVETSFPGANVGCVVTEQGVVVVDTPMLPEEADTLRRELGRLAQREVAYVVYTHQHFDHVMGAAYLTRRAIACGAAVSGIARLRTGLESELSLFSPDLYREKKEMFDGLDIVLPQITFDTELGMHMGDADLALSFVGGHSSASIIIHVPQARVLFAGDNVVTGQLPVTANGRFGPWIALLERIEGMELDVIVPGHGEVCGKEGVSATRRYFEAMRDRVREMAGAGASREDVAQGIDLRDCLPVPVSEEATAQAAFDAARMYDQMAKGLL